MPVEALAQKLYFKHRAKRAANSNLIVTKKLSLEENCLFTGGRASDEKDRYFSTSFDAWRYYALLELTQATSLAGGHAREETIVFNSWLIKNFYSMYGMNRYQKEW